MKKWLVVFALIAVLGSCTGKPSKKSFEVSGTITNGTNKMIYLERLPLATMQRIVMDSARLGKDGKYVLKADASEASVFNLRLDQSDYPLAAVINDTSKIIVDATLNKENNQFAESYDVKGSIASKKMKDFMYAFNNKLQAIFYNSKRTDSLQKTNASDSVLTLLQSERKKITDGLHEFTLESISKSNNPALTMFELGYYQSTANNNPGYKLEAFTNEKVSEIVNDAAAKFPNHDGVALIKNSLEAQIQKVQNWVGQQAPDFALPDVNGKEIKLSSFKGKYVLVDFWASWCGPCRKENPNVVKAFNKYSNKNFTILGVSLDEEKDEWKNAIQNDGLVWTQVSDLKHWNSKVVPLYNIEGIPYNVLIDPDGKIIAEDLRGLMLDVKLEKILK
jgi:peroxiredoxin